MYDRPDDIGNSRTVDEQPNDADQVQETGDNARSDAEGTGATANEQSTDEDEGQMAARNERPNAESSSGASSGRHRDIVKRSDHYIVDLDECGAYDYTHQLGGVTVEFVDGVASYAPEAVGAALLTIAGGSAQLGGMFGKASAIAIGHAAMQFDTDSLTLTSVEYDVGGGLWTQTMYKVNLCPDWHEESPNAGVPISTFIGHPGR